MRIFVTGGTGLLGNTILRQLSPAGTECLALVRGTSGGPVFDDVQAEFVNGDLSDRDVIFDAVAHCDAVIHSAALIHVGWKRREESMRVNRDGTANVVDACLCHGRKLVHVGTVDTLGLGTTQAPADETTPIENAGGQVPCSYVISKRAGVQQVQRGIDEGLRAVIVHPGFMLGPWDWKPSSGRMMWEVAKSWKPITPSGGCSVCDVRDVAAGVIAAVTADVPNGRHYVLAGHNWRYLNLWKAMADRMGVRRPLIAAGPLQRWIAAVAGDAWTVVAGETDINSAAVRMSSQFHWYDSSRAERELGYRVRDAEESLDAAAEFLREHHLLPKQPPV